jgi:pyridoxine 5-phosphate synthase
MDPDPAAMVAARALGAERVELYTEAYARAHGGAGQAASLERYRLAAEAALRAGLEVNAGHDLNLQNLGDFLREVPGIAEVSIGHALIGDALEFGLAETVRRYQAIIRTANLAAGGVPGAPGGTASANAGRPIGSPRFPA